MRKRLGLMFSCMMVVSPASAQQFYFPKTAVTDSIELAKKKKLILTNSVGSP